MKIVNTIVKAVYDKTNRRTAKPCSVAPGFGRLAGAEASNSASLALATGAKVCTTGLILFAVSIKESAVAFSSSSNFFKKEVGVPDVVVDVVVLVDEVADVDVCAQAADPSPDDCEQAGRVMGVEVTEVKIF